MCKKNFHFYPFPSPIPGGCRHLAEKLCLPENLLPGGRDGRGVDHRPRPSPSDSEAQKHKLSPLFGKPDTSLSSGIVAENGRASCPSAPPERQRGTNVIRGKRLISLHPQTRWRPSVPRRILQDAKAPRMQIASHHLWIKAIGQINSIPLPWHIDSSHLA